MRFSLLPLFPPPKPQVISLQTWISCSIALGVSHTYPGSIHLLHTVHCTQPPCRWSQSSPSAGYRSCSGKSLWRTCGPELVSAYRSRVRKKITRNWHRLFQYSPHQWFSGKVTIKTSTRRWKTTVSIMNDRNEIRLKWQQMLMASSLVSGYLHFIFIIRKIVVHRG